MSEALSIPQRRACRAVGQARTAAVGVGPSASADGGRAVAASPAVGISEDPRDVSGGRVPGWPRPCAPAVASARAASAAEDAQASAVGTSAGSITRYAALHIDHVWTCDFVKD